MATLDRVRLSVDTHRRPRVAILVLGRSGGLSGGDVHALRLAETWSRRQAAEVVLVGDPGLAQFIRDAPDLVHAPIRTPFDHRMSTSPLALVLGLVWRGISSVRQCRRADQVIASSHLVFDVFPAGLAGLLFNARLSSFVYHIIGDMGRPASTRASAAQSLESFSLWILRITGARIFVDNEEARTGLIERHHRPDLLFETANAYDPAIPIPSPDPAIPRRMAFVGRLVEQKGILDVLTLAQRLAEIGSDWQIDVVGTGPEHQRLASEVERHHLSNLQLHGFVDEETKWAILSTASLFLAPSREEGWGIAVGEALLAGVPVIAVDLPAYRHFQVPLERVPTGGQPFVERVLEFTNDHERLDAAAHALVGTSGMLPTWSEVLDRDIAVLMSRC